MRAYRSKTAESRRQRAHRPRTCHLLHPKHNHLFEPPESMPLGSPHVSPQLSPHTPKAHPILTIHRAFRASQRRNSLETRCANTTNAQATTAARLAIARTRCNLIHWIQWLDAPPEDSPAATQRPQMLRYKAHRRPCRPQMRPYTRPRHHTSSLDKGVVRINSSPPTQTGNPVV